MILLCSMVLVPIILFLSFTLFLLSLHVYFSFLVIYSFLTIVFFALLILFVNRIKENASIDFCLFITNWISLWSIETCSWRRRWIKWRHWHSIVVSTRRYKSHRRRHNVWIMKWHVYHYIRFYWIPM